MLLPVGTERIVFFAFLGIREYLVSLVDLLKLRLCLFITRIDVGMIFAGQFAKCLLDLIGRGSFRNAERFVIIFIIPAWFPL